jgi:hypothetical protein
MGTFSNTVQYVSFQSTVVTNLSLSGAVVVFECPLGLGECSGKHASQTGK